MKEIQLTQGQVAKVDDNKFNDLNKYGWTAWLNPHTKSWYARRKEKVNGKWIAIYMHRQIVSTPKGLVCDHVDHDTLNNQEENLRNCTNSQNLQNRSKAQTNNKLGILGVQRHGKTGFRAHIAIKGKQVNLPTRRTIEEALTDRRNAEAENYGEYSGSTSS